MIETTQRRALVRRTEHVIRPDPSRVIAKTFLPGQEFLMSGKSRASAVLDRVLALTEPEVVALLATTLASFGPRHRDLPETLEARFELVSHRLEDPAAITKERRQLIGAYFTQEYAIEAAALFNPSMVAHPDQSGLADGTTRFVMSLRGVGEGHISSIEFRTGTIDADDGVTLDAPARVAVLPTVIAPTYVKTLFAEQLQELGGEEDSVDYVLEALPDIFDRDQLTEALARLAGQSLTRGPVSVTIDQFEWVAANNYSITFPTDSLLSERVIIPTGPAESHGLEDLRLVRFTNPDGTFEYRGTYTAFNGSSIVPQLLRTTDFVTFHVSQLGGPAAKDKGMAMFPRRVHGEYLALSRWDRENNALASSEHMSYWFEASTLQSPSRTWEIVQLGNCGAPIETDAGWLVLTHGVGPMREYSIGAMLLDLDDPRIVLGELSEPLLRSTADERDGYVPNVVYSCGGMRHGRTLVLPYGRDDAMIRIALIDLPELLERLQQ